MSRYLGILNILIGTGLGYSIVLLLCWLLKKLVFCRGP